MKRFLAVLLMLAILLAGLTVTASAATKSGWEKDGDVWHYYIDGKMVENDWVKDGGKWYYIDGTDMVADRIMLIKGKWYGFDKSGAMAANNWYNEKGTDEDGYSWSNWFYAGADGAFVRGWKQIGGKWYYFEPQETWEYEGDVGVMAPYMYKSAYSKIGNAWYAFEASGAMIVGWGQPWLEYKDTDWVYANADGSLATGWKKVDGKWYYFYPDWPYMVRNTIAPIKDGKIDYESKTWYAFNKSGAMVENAWYQFTWEYDGKTWYGDWYYAGKDGALLKGWIKDNGKWYYLDPDECYMWSDWMGEMSDGNTYALKKNGEMAVGWYQSGDNWYYFKDSGAMEKKIWVNEGKKWYYLKEDGVMARNETLTIDGKEYTFGDDGAMK